MKFKLVALLLLSACAWAQNTKISALSSGDPAQSTDMIPIARGAANFRLSAGAIAALGGNFPDITDSGGVVSVTGAGGLKVGTGTGTVDAGASGTLKGGTVNISGSGGIIGSVTNGNIPIAPNGSGQVVFNAPTTCAATAINASGMGATTGFIFPTAQSFGWCVGNFMYFLLGANSGAGIRLTNAGNGGFIGFSSSGDATGPTDVEISRAAANVLSVDKGTQGNHDALIQSAMTQLVSGADYTNATTTPSNLVSWSLPATALKWAYVCDGSYQSSAGTATLALSINAQQAPTSEAASAIIYTNTTGAASTFTTATVSSTSAGNVAVLTGGAPAANNTNYLFRIYGSIEASSTAGTFAIQAAAGGTGTVTVKRDSLVCQLTP